MSDVPIPEDIRNAAMAVVERGYNEGLLDAVERALMAERERSAIVALEQRCERGTPWDLACTTIAAAIRRGTP